MFEDIWFNEGGNVSDEDDFEESGDREPNLPIAPRLRDGAALPLPEPEYEEELALV